MSRILAISGSRVLSFAQEENVRGTLNYEASRPEPITHVVVGCCPNGVDAVVDDWCRINRISMTRYAADWDVYGKKAGPIRNQKVVDTCTEWIAFPTIDSIGTRDFINKAKKSGKPGRVEELK